MRAELEKCSKMRSRFEQYSRAGKLKIFPIEDIEQKRESLPTLCSDDPDIIALAQVSGVSLLVSGDINLHADFKTIVRGKIYQTRVHKHLLRNDLCP